MKKSKREFGRIKAIGAHLYIDCRIYKERVRYASGVLDTKVNRVDARKFLDSVESAIGEGTFRFKAFFPYAKEKDQLKFLALEAKMLPVHMPLASEVVLKDFAKVWFEEERLTMNDSTVTDYRNFLNSRILPMLGDYTFSQLTGKTLKTFVRNMKHADGPDTGEYLSAKRMRNVLYVLRMIYREACLEYGWNLQDPFPVAYQRIKKIEKLIEQKGLKHDHSRDVWLLGEWVEFSKVVSPHYIPFFEAMRMGLIFSELKGLKKEHVFDDHIEVLTTISRGVEKSAGKTTFRMRNIPLTQRLRELINQAMESSDSDYVFVMEDGGMLNYTTIREDIWSMALTAAKLSKRKMYSLRHTFIGWMVLLGVNSARLKSIAGHSSRSTLTEDTYGDYREGLLSEKEQILEHLGRDILTPEEFKKSFPHIYLIESGIDVSTPPVTAGLSDDTIKQLASMVASEVVGARTSVLGIGGFTFPTAGSKADNYERLAS